MVQPAVDFVAHGAVVVVVVGDVEGDFNAHGMSPHVFIVVYCGDPTGRYPELGAYRRIRPR
jgi:hypothetical protein